MVLPKQRGGSRLNCRCGCDPRGNGRGHGKSHASNHAITVQYHASSGPGVTKVRADNAGGRRTGAAPAARRQLSPYSFPHAARGARSTDFMPKFPAGLQDPRYPFEPPPESCDFLGANIVTRAVWANGEAGIGMDFDLRLTRGWYAPCRIELEVPHALSHVPAVVHAVVRDKDVLSQPHNLISTRNERGGTSVRLGASSTPRRRPWRPRPARLRSRRTQDKRLLLPPGLQHGDPPPPSSPPTSLSPLSAPPNPYPGVWHAT